MEKSTVPYALVVDDDPLILMNACDILADAGFRVRDAGTGDEAKVLLETIGGSVIVLFSDVEMPGSLDGFALARHVAKHWPAIEIVIASGRVTPGPNDMPEKATFVAKPYSAHMIREHLREKLPDGKQPEPLKSAV